MFGGRSQQNVVRDRILQELYQTVSRWGLSVLDVWLTDVDAEEEEMRRAVQSEVRESMAGRGELAAHEARVAKGTIFGKVAADMARDARDHFGQEISVDQAAQFLMGFYQNEGALEVALRTADGHNDIMQLFYMQHLGMPLPRPLSLAGGAPAPPLLAPGPAAQQVAPGPVAQQVAPGPVAAPPDGSWIVGREGDIFLEYDGVSRHHARLEIVGGQLSITDLGSTNGTFVSGRQISPNVPTPVASSDTVSLGRSVSCSVEQLIAATHSRRLDPGRSTNIHGL